MTNKPDDTRSRTTPMQLRTGDERLQEALPKEEADLASLLVGRHVGNVRIIRWLGAGGMGEVYLGRDERLDRQVAVKVLRAERRFRPDVKVRFLREARILSRLDHPNICRLYDLVEAEGFDVLLLEYVPGRPLSEVSGGFSREEALRLAIEVADGLAAAHREQVVHRDLKPDNIMVGPDGSVKILDFGISRSLGRRSHDVDGTGEVEWSNISVDETAAGDILGTVAYMSPEQAGGEEVTTASDVFSFGLVLQEILTGQQAFDHFLEIPVLLSKVARGEVRPAKGLDSELDALLGDLLATQAGRRPTIEQARDCLEWILDRPQRRRRRLRRILVWSAVGIAVIGAAVSGLFMERHRRLCTGAEEQLFKVWDRVSQVETKQAFEEAGGASGLGAWEAIRRRLDDYTASWVAMRTEACEATHFRGDQSEELLDRRMACLDDRLAEVSALVQVYRDDASAVLPCAVEAAHALTPLEVCADAALLLARVPLPTDVDKRTRLALLRDQLARAKVLNDAGAWAESLMVLNGAQTAVEELDYSPLAAEYHFSRGLAVERLGRPQEADEDQVQAIWLAEAGRADRLAAQAWVRRVWLIGVVTSDFDRVPELTGFAEAAIRRLGGDPQLEAALANHLGVVASVQGRSDDALRDLGRALEIRRKLFGEDHPKVASTLINLSYVYEDMNQMEEAVEVGRRALDIRLKTLGPGHPTVLGSLLNVAGTLRRLGRPGEALELVDHAVELAQSAFPPDHPVVAVLLNDLAAWALDDGRIEEALDFAERALRIFELSPGPRSVEATDAHLNLGVAAFRMDDFSLGIEHCSSALEIRRELYSADHPDILSSLHCLAANLIAAGDFAGGVEALEEGVKIANSTDLERGLEAKIRFDLAQALWREDIDRERALSLGEQALEDLVGTVDEGDLKAEVESWLLRVAK
ncbi:MAG: serine/threonine-protein kinase [Thermoanaerobaculales bacterium]|nr:serine/threonine-protein kinase [Thermoanaerobaculales bacterium]